MNKSAKNHSRAGWLRIGSWIAVLGVWTLTACGYPLEQEIISSETKTKVIATGKTALLGGCSKNSNCRYGKYCKFTSCRIPRQLGRCVSRPLYCFNFTLRSPKPVCGCNGKNYRSLCEAAKAGVSSTSGRCRRRSSRRIKIYHTLRNVNSCTGEIFYRGGTYPRNWSTATAQGEENHLAASRLAPVGFQYPFTVTKIRYQLRNRYGRNGRNMPQCNYSLAHRVHVFVGSANNAPAGRPNMIYTFNIPAYIPPAIAINSRWITRTLPRPIVLQEGQAVFVAVKMVGQPGLNSLCVGNCLQTGVAEQNWWSNSARAPYPWVTLASFNLHNTFMITAGGHYYSTVTW